MTRLSNIDAEDANPIFKLAVGEDDLLMKLEKAVEDNTPLEELVKKHFWNSYTLRHHPRLRKLHDNLRT